MASSKNEEVEALEALRDKSAELVRYLDNMNDKLLQITSRTRVRGVGRGLGDGDYKLTYIFWLNAAVSLRVLENWSSVIAISKVSSASTAAASAGKPQAEKKLMLALLEIKEQRRGDQFVRSRQASPYLLFYFVIREVVVEGVACYLKKKPCAPEDLRSPSLRPSDKLDCSADPDRGTLGSAKPSSSFFPSILKVPPKESRYCGLCYKNSPGLDHHCTWLNTCIAESNYEAFYWLVVSAACQTLLQTVIGILMCTLWESEVKANAADGWDKAVIALLWIHNAACISLTNSFVLLAGFHTHKRRSSTPVAAAALELSKGSDTSRELLSPGVRATNPTEVAVAATQPDMILSERVNESEGIFEQVDLSSPSKMKKLSGAVVAPAVPATTGSPARPSSPPCRWALPRRWRCCWCAAPAKEEAKAVEEEEEVDMGGGMDMFGGDEDY
ncbi:Zinc finger, DHHC-type, palmitoyltransferase [Phytophthora cactorum]|nr:Zinc finger, DHHC-type, palmitoyltransferase [Phytophthora cactorum]